MRYTTTFYLFIYLLSTCVYNQVKELVSGQLFDRYDRLLLQQTLDTMTDVIYCPRQSCQCPVVIDETMGTCPSCDYVFCVFCKMAYHGISPCRITAGTTPHMHFMRSLFLLLLFFRSKLLLAKESTYNKAGLSVRPYIHTFVRPQSFSDFTEIWFVGRGR